MFVRQAAVQYRLWFDSDPDIDLIRRVVLARLGS
jgi:shikimate 5-dehydrogenase